ncbi:hypothetical protein TRFO_20876 [Tritrichomonas foetus]|uniref:Uncharacterized protein n=1 Tax=Tritrichomonas foetus TaxID=1144522 RepID=A0A1J4KF21_9EUKA|nr:hypothetical protein TRFO_20876 [Tritrichomonas foetus]|eukprot:OHT10057.1 hypothetical protein TRFO_20876 [Tritrichomonas foetus]
MDSFVSVNFKLTTNERYINEMEKTRPLSGSDEELIESSFKPEYVKQMLTYALISTDSKRKKLYKFLRGDMEDSRPSTARIFQPTKREADLVVRTPRGSIDFNHGIHGVPRNKAVNRYKFESTGIRGDGIFGWAEPLTPRPQEPARLSLFIAKKLMTPSAVNRIYDTIDGNYKILNEILKWCEKKANEVAVDKLFADPVLSPRAGMLETKAKNEEDHMYSTSHRFYKPHPPARSLRARARFQTNYKSNYMESFCDEIHQNLPTTVVPPYKPMSNNLPFAQFPDLGPLEMARNPVLEEQASQNRTMCKLNFAVFNAKTCL